MKWTLMKRIDASLKTMALKTMMTGKDRKYWTARPCTLFLRGGRPGAGAARITQPLGDKFLLRQSCLTTINAAIESILTLSELDHVPSDGYGTM